jgi:hypothetical protein
MAPTRETTGSWTHDTSARLGSVDGGMVLGLGRVREGTATSCTVRAASPAWLPLFPAGRRSGRCVGPLRRRSAPRLRIGVKLSRGMLLPGVEALGLRAHYKPRRHRS